jgi:hypothetical protein
VCDAETAFQGQGFIARAYRSCSTTDPVVCISAAGHGRYKHLQPRGSGLWTGGIRVCVRVCMRHFQASGGVFTCSAWCIHSEISKYTTVELAVDEIRH